jgi:ribosomal protein L2
LRAIDGGPCMLKSESNESIDPRPQMSLRLVTPSLQCLPLFTMLQPRLLTRSSQFSPHCPITCLRRTYATVVQTATTPPSAPSPPQATTGREPAPEFGALTTKTSNVILRTYKPRTPGIRHLKRPINDHLWKGKPHYPLTLAKVGHGKGGRNHTGKITVRHHGGGHRRRVRTVDFERKAAGEHTVERIEYDPNRSAHLALLTNNKTQTKSYIIAAEGMRTGDVVTSYRSGIPSDLLKSMGGVLDPGMLAAKTAFKGNCLPLHLVPSGTQVYNVGSTKDKGAVFCRSAGTYAIVVGKDDQPGKKFKHMIVRLQSGEVRKVDKDACATIGVASNPHWHFRQLGKAGRSRWLNIRPTVRGLAMNACTSFKSFRRLQLLTKRRRPSTRRWSR